MARIDYDGVVVAVRYDLQGQVDWVRAFERRGPAFSDYVMINRSSLVQKIKDGKKFMTGERVVYQAGTFNVHEIIRVIDHDGKDILVLGDNKADIDSLPGLPML